MPSPSAQGLLNAAGQTLQLWLGNTGVGQPADVSAIIAVTGIYQAATIGIEAIPLGQPLVQPSQAGPFQVPSPVSTSEWIPITELAIVNGSVLSSPVGPLTSVGGPGTGFGWTIPAGIYQAVQVRVISIGGGAIQASIASVPFPSSSSIGSASNPVSQLELSRIRFGISDLVGYSLGDLTAADFQ